MFERDVSEAFAKWAGDLLEVDENSRYPYLVADTQGPLPDLVAVVDRKRIVPVDQALESFPWLQLQQDGPLIRIFDVAMSIRVEVENTEQAALEGFRELQRFGSVLEVAALAAFEGGPDLPLVSPFMSFDYSEPFGRSADGTTGRMLVCGFVAGEAVGDFDEFG